MAINQRRLCGSVSSPLLHPCCSSLHLSWVSLSLSLSFYFDLPLDLIQGICMSCQLAVLGLYCLCTVSVVSECCCVAQTNRLCSQIFFIAITMSINLFIPLLVTITAVYMYILPLVSIYLSCYWSLLLLLPCIDTEQIYKHNM